MGGWVGGWVGGCVCRGGWVGGCGGGWVRVCVWWVVGWVGVDPTTSRLDFRWATRYGEGDLPVIPTHPPTHPHTNRVQHLIRTASFSSFQPTPP